TYNSDYAQRYRTYRIGAEPGAAGVSELRTTYATPLYLLLGIAGLVLLIACANLANLLLARGSARQPEIAVRLARGAAPARVVRQLMVESLLLAVAGAALGLLLAHLLSGVLVGLLRATDEELLVDLRYDWRVLGFTIALAGVTCVLFGLAPALRAARTDVGLVLKAAGGRGATEGRERFAARRIL